MALAGADALARAAQDHVGAGEPVAALHLTDIVLAVDPEDAGRAGRRRRATRALLGSDNFWERAWLDRSVGRLEAREQHRHLRILRRRVLVTGGTSGIGHALASGFTDAGATVAVTGTKRAPPSTRRTSTGSPISRCEMTDPGTVDAVAQSLDELDILVNNAGANFPGGRDEWEPEVFATSLDLNLAGPMRLTTGVRHLLAASTIEGGASVVNMASLSAFRSVPIVPGYGSAKAGTGDPHRNLARHWVHDGIRVNAVAPGVIDTPMTAPMAQFTELLDAELAHTPMGRLGTPAMWSPPCCSSPARLPASSPAISSSSTADTFSHELGPCRRTTTSVSWSRISPPRRPS